MERGLKGSILSLFLTIMLTGITAAQFYSGYGNFSPRGGFQDILDPETIIYGGLFIIIFTFILFSLSKIFKNPDGTPSKAVSVGIAFPAAAMATFGIYWSSWNPVDFLYRWDIFYNFSETILPLIFLGLIILLIWRFKFANTLIILGLLFIGLSATDLVYEGGWVLLMGLLLIIIGIWLKRRGRKGMDPEERLRQYRAKGELKDLKRERFEKRFGQYASTAGKAAGTATGYAGSWWSRRKEAKRAQREGRERQEQERRRQWEEQRQQQEQKDARTRQQEEKRYRNEEERYQRQQQEKQRKEERENQEKAEKEYRKQQEQARAAEEERTRAEEDYRRQQQEQQKREEAKQRRLLKESKEAQEERERIERERQAQMRNDQALMDNWGKDEGIFRRILQGDDVKQKKREYRRLMIKYHPDKNRDSTVANKISQEINRLWKVYAK